MYTERDAQMAVKSLLRVALIMAAVLLVLLAGYITVLVKGEAALAAILAVGMLVFGLFFGDLLLLPRLRYVRFLKEMGRGLRRSVDCILQETDENVQRQDGVFVRALQVQLDDGDSRIYYLNASKMDFLPETGSRVRLVSYGRHVVEFMVI